jgi:hypothetical protein
VNRVSRTRARPEPGLSRAERKRRRVTWGRRCASVEIPVVKHGECHPESGSLIMLSCTCDVIVAELTCYCLCECQKVELIVGRRRLL